MSLGAGVAHGCELPHMGAESQMQVVWRKSKFS